MRPDRRWKVIHIGFVDYDSLQMKRDLSVGTGTVAGTEITT